MVLTPANPCSTSKKAEKDTKLTVDTSLKFKVFQTQLSRRWPCLFWRRRGSRERRKEEAPTSVHFILERASKRERARKKPNSLLLVHVPPLRHLGTAREAAHGFCPPLQFCSRLHDLQKAVPDPCGSVEFFDNESIGIVDTMAATAAAAASLGAPPSLLLRCQANPC